MSIQVECQQADDSANSAARPLFSWSSLCNFAIQFLGRLSFAMTRRGGRRRAEEKESKSSKRRRRRRQNWLAAAAACPPPPHILGKLRTQNETHTESVERECDAHSFHLTRNGKFYWRAPHRIELEWGRGGEERNRENAVGSRRAARLDVRFGCLSEVVLYRRSSVWLRNDVRRPFPLECTYTVCLCRLLSAMQQERKTSRFSHWPGRTGALKALAQLPPANGNSIDWRLAGAGRQTGPPRQQQKRQRKSE